MFQPSATIGNLVRIGSTKWWYWICFWKLPKKYRIMSVRHTLDGGCITTIELQRHYWWQSAPVVDSSLHINETFNRIKDIYKGDCT